MPLMTGREILEAAREGGYAVGAFNCHTLEMIPAVAEVASAERAPVILQFTPSSVRFMGWGPLAAVAQAVAMAAPVPVALHLDHGASLEIIAEAIAHGFTSVMIDGSERPFAENVALTRQVVAAAHAAGVSVEAEIGHVGGVEDGQGGEHAWLTDPADARRFCEAAGMDSLAPAFGTAHGLYKEEPRLDFARLRAIRELVPVPLVMHGGSGVPALQVQEAIAAGICKINVATELKEVWAKALRETLAAHPTESDPRRLLAPPRQALQAVVREKIRLFGSQNRI